MAVIVIYAYFQGFFAGVEETLGAEQTEPLLVTHQGRVLDFCLRAARAGVVEGIPVGHALTRCPGARTVTFDPGRYAAQGRRVLELVELLVASLEPVGPNELYIDPGPAPRETAQTLAALPVPGHRLVAVLAPGKALARGLGRWRRQLPGDGPLDLLVIDRDPGSASEAIRDVPLEFLSPCPRATAALERLGVKTAGQAASLPTRFLTRRFGEAGYVLSRLCRGRDGSRLDPRHRDLWKEERFDIEREGTGSELDVIRALDHMAAGLVAALDGRGCRSLRLEVRGQGWTLAREFSPGRVLSGTGALQPGLVNLWRGMKQVPGISGPVASVRAWACDVVEADQRQLTLMGRQRSRQEAAQVLSSLQSRFPMRLGGGEGDRREMILRHWDPLRFGDQAR